MTPQIYEVQTEIEKRVFGDWIDFKLTKGQKKLDGDSREIDMEMYLMSNIEIFHSYLMFYLSSQVKLRKCHSPIRMKLYKFVEFGKIIDTYFFISPKVHV